MDDEEEEEEGGDTSDGPVAQHTPSLNKQPPASALKKSPSDSGVSSAYDVCELKYLLQYRLYDCHAVCTANARNGRPIGIKLFCSVWYQPLTLSDSVLSLISRFLQSFSYQCV